ncbi:hypothetical protein U1Q18_034778 [Sarracenia purpurea var. burkii]
MPFQFHQTNIEEDRPDNFIRQTLKRIDVTRGGGFGVDCSGGGGDDNDGERMVLREMRRFGRERRMEVWMVEDKMSTTVPTESGRWFRGQWWGDAMTERGRMSRGMAPVEKGRLGLIWRI